MNIDWVVVAVISSVAAMIVASGMFIYYVMKHMDEDKSQDR